MANSKATEALTCLLTVMVGICLVISCSFVSYAIISTLSFYFYVVIAHTGHVLVIIFFIAE